MGKFIKRFRKWMTIAKRLDDSEHAPPLFKEGEIWWCHLGDNIGTEISGKGDMFDRPVLILRKLDHQSFIGLPLLGKKKGGDWYVPVRLGNRDATIFLAQVKYIDYRRMDNFMTAITNTELMVIREKFINFIVGNIPRPPSEEERADVGNPKT